jgi:hypothetical protein
MLAGFAIHHSADLDLARASTTLHARIVHGCPNNNHLRLRFGDATPSPLPAPQPMSTFKGIIAGKLHLALQCTCTNIIPQNFPG